MPYEKTMTLDDIAESLALLCLAEWSFEDTPKPFGLKPLHKEIETLNKFAFFEATFLSCFAVDYGLTVVLGQDSPDRKEILAASRDKIIQRLGPDFGHIIANGLNERLTNYAVAYHQALSETNKPEMVPYIIGETFNIFFYEDKPGDPEVSVKAGVHFCEVVETVTRFLKSIRIGRSNNSLVLYKQQNPLPESSEENYFIDFIGAELKKDIDYLVGLGIKLDKGALAAKTGGAAWAGYEAFTGDWLSALVIGGITLLTDSLTDGYKRIKLMENKQKWMHRLSGLDGKELEYLVIGLRRKYPLLLGQFQNLLQAGRE